VNISPLRIVRGTCIALVVSAFLPQVTAVAAECAQDNYTEAGTCAPVLPDTPMTAFQTAQQAEKDAALAAMNSVPSSDDPSSSSPEPRSTNPGDGASTPTSYYLSEVAKMTIYKEGQGNDKKSYTCGPSATRNMVAAMYKRKYGAYKDFGEHRFELWEGTTTNGTARANVAKTLNDHFSGFGHWTTSRPSSANSYFNTVKLDSYAYHQSVIANVDTEELSFFKDHPLNHFDFVYGYDLDGATHYLWIAEEWDPAYIYGSADYQPYGRHHERLTNAYSAITKTAIHGIVS